MCFRQSIFFDRSTNKHDLLKYSEIQQISTDIKRPNLEIQIISITEFKRPNLGVKIIYIIENTKVLQNLKDRPWRLGMLPNSGGIRPDRLLTLRYKSVSSLELVISLGILPFKELKCRYRPVKLLSWPTAGGIWP